MPPRSLLTCTTPAHSCFGAAGFGPSRCASNQLRYRFADVWTRCGTGVHSISLCFCSSCDKIVPSFTACTRVYLQVCSSSCPCRYSRCFAYFICTSLVLFFPAGRVLSFPRLPPCHPFVFRSSLPSTSLRSFLCRPPPSLISLLSFCCIVWVFLCVPLWTTAIMECFPFCPRVWSHT